MSEFHEMVIVGLKHIIIFVTEKIRNDQTRNNILNMSNPEIQW